MSRLARRLSRAVPSAVSSGAITHGQQVSATNVGLAGAGISESSLTSSAGINISSSNTTISGRKFTGQVNVNGDDVIIEKCLVEFSGKDTFGIKIFGNNCIVRDCTIRSSGSYYNCIQTGDGTTVLRCDMSGGENIVELGDSTDVTLDTCYFHDPSISSDPAGHPDGLELFTTTNITVIRCRISTVGWPDGAINLSPYGSTSYAANGLYITDNFIDGGQEHILIDDQTTFQPNCLNVQVLRNVFGGHSDPGTFGRYNALLDHDGRGTVETLAAQQATPSKIWWPTSGANANYWGKLPDSLLPSECSDLTPDKTAQIAIP